MTLSDDAYIAYITMNSSSDCPSEQNECSKKINRFKIINIVGYDVWVVGLIHYVFFFIVSVIVTMTFTFIHSLFNLLIYFLKMNLNFSFCISS